MNGMNDGGERITYGADGAMREPTTGKGRYDLITPFGLRRLAKWYELGAAKYTKKTSGNKEEVLNEICKEIVKILPAEIVERKFIAKDCVGTVMSAILGQEIPDMPNGKEPMRVNGIKTIRNGSKSVESNEEQTQKNGPGTSGPIGLQTCGVSASPKKRLVCLWKDKEVPAQFVAETLGRWEQCILTMTIKQTLQEDTYVVVATTDLECLTNLLNFLKRQYDTLTILQRWALSKNEDGALKFIISGDRNWERGIPYSRCIDSAKRHIDKFLMGESSEDHLAAAAWNIMAIMHYQDAGPNGLDDLPKYGRGPGPQTTPVPQDRQYKIVAVDFDGCLCENKWPGIGKPNWRLIDELRERREKLGDKLILWTCREGESLKAAVSWCRWMGLHFDAVNENLPEQKARYGNDCRKIGADEYIDDKARRREYRAEGGSE